MSKGAQHYIGIGPFGRVRVTFDHATLIELKMSPIGPLTIYHVTFYPVSAEIAQEWDRDKSTPAND